MENPFPTPDVPQPAVVVKSTESYGKGVYARRAFTRGDQVLEFGGPRVHLDEITAFERFLEIGDGWFLGPSGKPDDFVNHSCEPNCAVSFDGGRPALVALRNISEGDQITFDYSTCMIRDRTAFECSCGSPDCRGTVGPAQTLPRSLREQYRQQGALPEFVLEALPLAVNGQGR
ncbi:MAG: SET domain-containing protein [Bdellovibrionales bacterium]|nr:SET domain-containing protein [Bdellovibrionales bacterium]